MRKGPGKIAGYAIKHIFKKPATVKYPFGELIIDKNYRGKICYDPTNCIGCNLCSRDCPAAAIEIVNVGTKEEKVFECHMNLAHCIFCAQCVDSCRKGCLKISPNIELAAFSRDALKVKL